MPAVRALEDRSRALSEALLAQDVLAYRGAIDTGAMLDTLVALHEELNDRPFLNSPNVREFVSRYTKSVGDIKGWRLGKGDFEFIRTLARGQFGIVDIVRSKHNKGVYAMKTLNKQALLSQREQAAFLEERDVLVLGKDSPWIPDLYASFQDRENLYIVMEFVAGGDLFSMLDRCENAVIDEDSARFYAAELVLALEDLHKIGYIHRDCKPQNTLLDARGHVKLADFGSCARIDASGAHEAKTSVPVGTCDYIAPETLRARELGSGAAGSGAVSAACDWWSLGTVLYEMLYGDPPFYSDSVPETYGKIMASEKHLAFDEGVAVSAAAKDLMRRLLVRQEDRLGVEGIKAHAFFAGVDWAGIRAQQAPFVPSISSADDTSNFSVGDEADEDIGMAMARASSSRLGHGREYAGEQLPFIGFTYLPPAFAAEAKRLAGAATPRGPRDDPAQVKALRARVAQLEAKDARWLALQAEWDEERRRASVERKELELRCAALEAQALVQAPVQVPPAVRDSAMQTEAPAGVDAAAEADDAEDTETAETGVAALAESIQAQFGGQAAQLAKLVDAVNAVAAATGDKLHEGLQAQRKELGALAALIQQQQQHAQPQQPQQQAATNSPRLTSVASLSQVYQTPNGSSARLSIGGSSGGSQTPRAARRSISAVDDASQLDSHPKSVVATLVNEMTRTPSDQGSPTGSRQGLAVSPAGALGRVARADRRVSTGVAGDALSVIGSKCDRLALLLEQYAGEIDAIRQSQGSLMALCSALHDATAAATAEGARGLAEIPESPTPDPAASRRSRRRTEQPRRRAIDTPGSPLQPPQPQYDPTVVDMYRAAADELAATLRSQLASSEEARVAAEARAAELLGWIGRESKGRALLEDMIRTAQQACKMAEDKFDAMSRDGAALRAQLAAGHEQIADLQATVEVRDKELRHLRRASRKALDQLAEIKGAGQQPPGAAEEKSRGEMDAELQEAAAVHVRLQFEIARLEGDVSRLEAEKARLAKELAIKDSRLKVAESRTHVPDHTAAASSSSDGIRVRAMDGSRPTTAHTADDDDTANNKFGSVGTKSHKRFKVQLQNMQKHIEFLETKLALAVSENDQLRKHQHGGSHGIRIPGFSRSGSSNSSHTAHASASAATGAPAGAKPHPLNTLFPNLASNLDSAFGSTASLNTAERSEPDDAAEPASPHHHHHQHQQHQQHHDGHYANHQSRRRVPTEPLSASSTRPRNDSLTSSFERMRSPFKGFRKHFT
ncbi:Serine/threonine-protein kinase MRCK beta [Coemansia erecta]|uniref:non-specific serine/threonine protein kinase n=1 Tax=Coemansia erecta TaxID=147472 RepID=A0A9W7XYV9_9FUNG|nr:Serine/threonine-protein kinase MRCK beta [Coemansia erecta]